MTQPVNVLTIPPTAEPVTLAEMRDYLGITAIDNVSRDSIITEQITSARVKFESFTQKSFMQQTRTLYADCFLDVFKLKAPLKSVTSIIYIDSDGSQQTLASSEYFVDTARSEVLPAYGKSWPASRNSRNSVEILHVSGESNAANVRQTTKQAIKVFVKHFEDFSSEVHTDIGGSGRILPLPNLIQDLLSEEVDTRFKF